MSNVLNGQRIRVQGGANLRFIFEAFFLILLLVLVASIYLWSRLEVVHIGYDISVVKREKRSLEEENKRLRFEVMALRSPQRIERIASGRLGLTYPSGKSIVYYDE